MKKFIFLFISLISLQFVSAKTEFQTDIEIQIKNYPDSVFYLAYYYAEHNKKQIADTIVVNSKGIGKIQKEERLPSGIYMMVNQTQTNYFEFIIDQNQKFELSTIEGDYNPSMKVKGSIQNEKYFEYNLFIEQKGKERQKSQEELDVAKKANDSAKTLKLEAQIASIDNKVREYKANFRKQYPDHLISAVFNLMDDVVVPEEITDQDEKFKYYKKHYFDKIDFSKEGIVRTPVFKRKIITYLDNLVIQHYDSLIQAAFYISDMAKANDEVFKYVVHTITFKYQASKIMCFDKIFVAMVDNYYSKGLCPWVDDVFLAKVEGRAKDLRYVLCGNAPVNLNLYGLDKKYHSLYGVNAAYTVIWFWDSDCGHCQKQTPKLKKLVESDIFKDSLKVYGVNIEFNSTAEFKKFVEEKDLGDWINVSDTVHLSKFRDYYDIYSTPVLYLLDKDKKIIAKRLDPESLYEYLLKLWKMDIPEEEKLFYKKEEKEDKDQSEHNDHDGHNHDGHNHDGH